MGKITSALKSFFQAAPPTRAKGVASEPKSETVKPKKLDKDTISQHPDVGKEPIWQGKQPPRSR